MSTKSIAVIVAGLLLLTAAGPAVANDGSFAVAVDQDDGGNATVTVTHNGTTVENASVDVNTTDENVTYAGEGNYTTDANGTVGLPAPDENVTVLVVAESDNGTDTTTAELVAAAEAGSEADSFGARVSAYVHELLDGADDRERIGRQIAEWVVENNPGNAPDHAGPPDDHDDRGNAGARGNGPPADRGQQGNGASHANGR